MIKEIADPSPSGYGGGEGEQQGTEIQKARLMAPWIAGGICVLAAAVWYLPKRKKAWNNTGKRNDTAVRCVIVVYRKISTPIFL